MGKSAVRIAEVKLCIDYKGFEVFVFNDGSFEMISDDAVIGGSFTSIEECKAAIDDYEIAEESCEEG